MCERLKELGSVCLCSPGCSVGNADLELKRATTCLCLVSAQVSLAKKLDSDVREDGRTVCPSGANTSKGRSPWTPGVEQNRPLITTHRVKAIKKQFKRNMYKMATHLKATELNQL